MPRKTKKTAEPVVIENDIAEHAEELEASANQLAEHSQTIMTLYADGLPYDRRFFMQKAREHIRRSAEEALELGKCLIVMKENEPHGDWLTILDDIGIHPRLAQRTMQASIKFANPSSTTRLLEAANSKTKLFELMVLDDDELAELNDGGTVAGIDIDDVNRMSCTELRKALREARADMEAKNAVAATKSARIDELLEETQRIKKLPPDEVAAQLRKEASAYADETEEAIRAQLREAFSAVLEHGAINPENPLLENNQVDWLSHRLDLLDEALFTLREELGIEKSVKSSGAWDK